VDPGRILSGLNLEQRRAVEAVRGPVCILAGAGSGKTTTITRRIANQVASGTFEPSQILAVTFTDKAAGEMRLRLAALGVDGVQARTFHSAALAQLRAFGGGFAGEVLASKALLLRQIGNGLPTPFRFRPAGDLATEVEWAKNRRLTPHTYSRGLDGHEPPIPVDLMERVFGEYERRKEASGKLDFEDLLEHAIRVLDDDPGAREAFRSRFCAFTVDEYQDVNLLQQSLLERWLGDRDDLCAVGDDYQSIYAFVGATPRHLIEMPARFQQVTVVRLERNYRSTPEVLELANRLVPVLGGVEKRLEAVKPSGPDPVVRTVAPAAETAFVVERIQELAAAGVPLHEIAVLYRTNARSDGFEEALSAAGVPFEVRGTAFLARQAPRRLLAAVRASESTSIEPTVRELAVAQGWIEGSAERLGEQEAVRQADLRRLVDLADELDDGTRTLARFVQELEARFGPGRAGRGVNLLTYHASKGLEFEAVFLPRLEEKELPGRQAKRPAALADERRLLYVGITRAKRYLYVTWSDSAKPSRFLAELGVSVPVRARRSPVEPADREQPAFRALREWRRERALADGVPAYVVLHDTTLAEIVRRTPRSRDELAAIPGIGPTKLDRYGSDVLAALGEVA
jgi:DNA helicase-2/ATP-dependent DNA helicase PcrA